MSVVASRKVNFIVLRVRHALYITRLFIIGTIRGVTSGERFKKHLDCGVYEVISLRKWPSSYDCMSRCVAYIHDPITTLNFDLKGQIYRVFDMFSCPTHNFFLD